jgi:hypothetical protein
MHQVRALEDFLDRSQAALSEVPQADAGQSKSALQDWQDAHLPFFAHEKRISTAPKRRRGTDAPTQKVFSRARAQVLG